MIYIDPPQEYQVKGLMRGRKFRSSHLISSKGTEELVEFGRKIGMRQDWLQCAGTWREHYDVMNTRFNEAIDAGAKLVTAKELVARMMKKSDSLRPLGMGWLAMQKKKRG